MFQSTHPRGVRHRRVNDAALRGLVSIHAPAWGATLFFGSNILAMLSFNPRTRVGCDSHAVAPLKIRRMFQSTHPRGVRQQRRGSSPQQKRFQSTHPRGVRPG